VPDNTNDRHMSICPVCGIADWASVYRIGRWDIGECKACGFARIDPMPDRELRAEFYSEEKVVSRNTKEQTASQRFSRSMKRFFSRIGGRSKSGIFYDKLSHYLSAGSKILDLGCGDGSFLRSAKRCFLCTGVEISGYLAGLAKDKGGIKVINGNFLEMEIGEKFDGITMISLLEHLDDPAKALKICFGLLNRNGVLLIKTINYGCLNRMIKRESWSGFRPPDHMVYFTPRNLKQLLEKAGFAGIKVSAWPFNDNMYCDAHKIG